MDQRNLLLAVVLSVSILLIWQFVFETPRMEKELAARSETQQQSNATTPSGASVPAAPGAGAPPVPTAGAPPVAGAGAQVPTLSAPVAGRPAAPKVPVRQSVIGASARITVNAPRLQGSIRLKGGLIDDLTLVDYRETTEPGSGRINLLSPIGAPAPYYAQFGWVAGGAGLAVPDDNTPWVANRRSLALGKPVTLRWDNGKGLKFTRVIAIDENYVFTINQRVENNSAQAVTLYPYGLISRTGTPDTLGYFILHEGLYGVFNDTLMEVDYDDLQDAGQIRERTKGGWIGITDKYWLAALIPDQKVEVDVDFRHALQDKLDKYQVDYLGGERTVRPGRSVEISNRLFVGAKEVRLLDDYAEKYGIARFDLAVDWGWFYFLTKPIFYVLEYFHGVLGNFGLAILLLTVLIKLAFFPLANTSYKSMSRLKQLQPQMADIKERYEGDRTKQNEAMMKLYKDQNANPMSGCAPMLIQIPVFFALYKVLFVSIEMRHAPFYGWIRDLSAPDPTNLFDLFGLIPWSPPEFLMIGVWPIIMGVTMFLQQKLNPAPADPAQAKIFMFLPFVFTIMLARFPAGLVIYWAWNNLLSITQQYIIMRRMGVAIGGGSTSPSGKSAGAKSAGGKPAGGSGTKRSKGGGSTPPSGKPARGNSSRNKKRKSGGNR